MSTTSPSTERTEELRAQIDFLREELDDAHFRIAGLEEELHEYRKKTKRQERELAKYETEGVGPNKAQELFDYWVAAVGKNPKTTKLSPDRRKAINAAVKLRGEANVRRIIDQGAKTPYLVYGHFKASGAADSLRNEIADWLGKGKYAEALLDMALARPEINWTEERVAEAHSLLLSTEAVLDRLEEGKGWTPGTLEGLGIGLAEGRLIFPIRDEDGNLTGVIKYHPRFRETDKHLPKSIAEGPRGLFPSPEDIEGDTVWLVEGEPDAVTAHEMWLPGVAIPGVGISPGKWMERLRGKRVVICFDCDDAGRKAASKLARPLTQYATDVRIIDLDPARSDGYDLTDWFRSGRQRKTLEDMAKAAKPVANVRTPQLPPQQNFTSSGDDHDALFNDFVRALEQRDCDPKEGRGGQWIARCPHHDDKVPTLHFKRGEKTPVVADCKAGCPWPDIKETLAWPARKEW